MSAGQRQVGDAGAPLSLTVVILTYNEEPHIARCIDSVRAIAERIVVVDSFSTDRTAEIARGLGAGVVERAFKHQADQFQWALDTQAIKTAWTLRLDADEYLEPGLAAELRARLPTLPEGVTGVRMKRKVVFRGRWIRWGGYYPAVFLRLWRTGAARIEQRWMDEHVVLTRGEAILFAHDFVDANLNDITWWTEKHNRFATRQMVDFINLEHRLFPLDHGVGEAAGGQASVKRFLRNKVFARTPLYLRAVLYYLQRYVLRLGFLDGRQGFVFHFLQGFWNWMLVDAKIDEARAFIALHGVDAFKRHLKERHNIDVGS